MKHALLRLHRFLLPDEPGIGWMPYVWLVYLSFFFIRYGYVTPSGGEVAAIAVTLVAFFTLYFAGYWRRGWGEVPIVAGLAIIGTAWAPVNPGAGVFFIYAASFAAWIGPVPRAAFAIGFTIVWAMVVAVLWQQNPIFWMPALVFGTIVGIVNVYYAGEARRAAALRLSQEEVRQLAQVAERERISRDLHDLLGHTLSVITLKAELAARLVEREPARAAEEIREVERISRSALAEVREAVSGIRARGLAGELEHARLALKAAGVTGEVEGAPDGIPPTHEAVLAMVVREAVTNVVRHADAQKCRIAVENGSDGYTVEVRDDGRGGAVGGSGIDGMRARVAAVGGRLEVAEDYGTRVRAWLPR